MCCKETKQFNNLEGEKRLVGNLFEDISAIIFIVAYSIYCIQNVHSVTFPWLNSAMSSKHLTSWPKVNCVLALQCKRNTFSVDFPFDPLTSWLVGKTTMQWDENFFITLYITYYFINTHKGLISITNTVTSAHHNNKSIQIQ